jgi:hypothetical protein
MAHKTVEAPFLHGGALATMLATEATRATTASASPRSMLSRTLLAKVYEIVLRETSKRRELIEARRKQEEEQE